MSSGNPGQMAGSLAQIGQAVKLLQAVIQNLPIGSPPHKAVMDSISKLSKVVPEGDQTPGIQKTALNTLNQQQQQQAPMMAMLSSMGRPQGMGGEPQQAA